MAGAAGFYGTSVQPPCDWPAAEPIKTIRLILEPLRVAHADEMVAVLDDRGLYAHMVASLPVSTCCEPAMPGRPPGARLTGRTVG